jgi:hypothetical protein
VAVGGKELEPQSRRVGYNDERKGEDETVGTQGGASALNAPTSETPADNETPQDAAKAAAEELARWERFALKRLGRGQGRPFAVRALPAEVAFEVAAGLLAAQTEDEAKAVFKEARAQLAVSS